MKYFHRHRSRHIWLRLGLAHIWEGIVTVVTFGHFYTHTLDSALSERAWPEKDK